MKNTAILLVLLVTSFFGNAQSGNCTSGDCQNGYGTMVWTDGNTYTGDFKDGYLTGKGTLTSANGNSYSGDWVDTFVSGYGVYKWADGSKYEGHYLKNKREGEGKMTLANGYYIIGVFKDNYPDNVKYFDDKNHEITQAVYDEVKQREKEKTVAQNKGKLQLQTITIPAPNGAYSMTDRDGILFMQFSTTTKDFLYIWGKSINIFSASQAKILGRTTSTGLQSDFGKEIVADFNQNAYKRNSEYDPHSTNSGNGYCDNNYQIKINNGEPFSLNANNTYAISLYNYQKNAEEENLVNFNFWQSPQELKTFLKTEKENYLAIFENKKNPTKADRSSAKRAKDEYEIDHPRTLTDVHASYDAVKKIAHVIFTFSDLYPNCYNLMYDIDFKNKTYKKVAESKDIATVTKDYYCYDTGHWKDNVTETWYKTYRILNFDDNTTIDIDKPYLDKLNNLTNPPGNVAFETSNNEYLLFKSMKGFPDTEYSYYFVNKKNNFCEKIVTLKAMHGATTKPGNIVWNNDLSKACFSRRYSIDSYAYEVATASVIDFDNLTVQLLDDHQYQLDAINDKIQKDKQDAEDLSAWYVQYYAKNDAINNRNAAIQSENDKAQAERTAKCQCCHGTGKVEVKGMYMGEKTYSVTPVNGTGISHEETQSSYGASTYVQCSCCIK